MRCRYTNPYFTVDGVSQGFDIYKRRPTPRASRSAPTAPTRSAAGCKFGYPVSEIDSVDFGLNARDGRSSTTFADSPQRYIDFVRDVRQANTATARLTAGWRATRRDSVI